MANRNTLHISKLEAFKNWLIKDGWEILPLSKNPYEVLRASKLGILNPLIVYSGKSKEHLSFANEWLPVVEVFLHKKTNADRIRRMQDRYLFRGKRIDNGEWVHGYLFDDGFENGRVFIGGIVIEKYNGTACDDWNVTGINFYEIDPNTICQCTGLKDKNGNLIWENDIVAYWDSYSTESGLTEANCVGKVVWDDETISFQVTNRLSAESYEVLGDECSVLGNVFDNPELLEV